MRIVMSSLIVVTFVGCVVDDPPPLGEDESALSCPDPERCLVNNGGGTYTEEFGVASIGADHFMIMRFVDVSSGGNDIAVNVRGRYFDPSTPTWRYDTTLITRAYYLGRAYLPVKVTETLTVPTWKLHDSSTNTDTLVTGPDLLNLQLELKRAGATYLLSFDFEKSEANNGVSIEEFNMRWSANGGAPTQYCFHAPPLHNGDGGPDSVVFQQGIGVNPLDASVVFDDSYVTLSCRGGAPATARLWGYHYRGGTTQTNLFRAALRMKRASYCGDDSFYTVANTPIAVWDDQGYETADLNHPDVIDDLVEAVWDVNGATCVNLTQRRHRQADYPYGSGDMFSRDCLDSSGQLVRHIPTCSTTTVGRLIDQAVDPQP